MRWVDQDYAWEPAMCYAHLDISHNGKMWLNQFKPQWNDILLKLYKSLAYESQQPWLWYVCFEEKTAWNGLVFD